MEYLFLYAAEKHKNTTTKTRSGGALPLTITTLNLWVWMSEYVRSRTPPQKHHHFANESRCCFGDHTALDTTWPCKTQPRKHYHTTTKTPPQKHHHMKGHIVNQAGQCCWLGRAYAVAKEMWFWKIEKQLYETSGIFISLRSWKALREMHAVVCWQVQRRRTSHVVQIKRAGLGRTQWRGFTVDNHCVFAITQSLSLNEWIC